MKRHLLIVGVLLLLVGLVSAQDEQDTDSAFPEDTMRVVWQTVGEGEFARAEEGDLLTLTLGDLSSELQYVLVAPERGFGRLAAEPFNTVLDSIEGLEGLDAVLDLEEQRLILSLSDFQLVDDETMTVTVESIEILPKTDSKSAEDIPSEFEEGDLLFYFDADSMTAYQAAQEALSADLRNDDTDDGGDDF